MQRRKIGHETRQMYTPRAFKFMIGSESKSETIKHIVWEYVHLCAVLVYRYDHETQLCMCQYIPLEAVDRQQITRIHNRSQDGLSKNIGFWKISQSC